MTTTKGLTRLAVEIRGQSANAAVKIFPGNYWAFIFLRLEKTNSDQSIDEAGAKKLNTAANAPLTYVLDLQNDLLTLGYLKKGSPDGVFGTGTRRAVARFQRHAARVYRMPGPADVKPNQVFSGKTNGTCDQMTALEMQKWLDAGHINPIGRFRLRSLNVAGAAARHKLREDAANEWENAVKLVAAAGGILTAEGLTYGDSIRGLAKTSKQGTSSFSFHYCGRAVDIDQSFAGRRNKLRTHRYFVTREDLNGQTFWRVLCRTEKQDGSQGFHVGAGSRKYVANLAKQVESVLPAAHYVDMTTIIESTGKFKRIKPQKGFDDPSLKPEVRYNKTEWWHFQYIVDIQETFLDELELIGKSEADVIAAGWTTIAELDHAPG